ncbi:MAG: TRAP transporter large permease subunit, partial [Alphaproteobacteria bacterium]
SIVLIILGEQISNAYVTAEGIRGNWSPEPVSVGDLFAGALLPGLLLVGLYILYQIAIAILKPSAAPALKPELQTPGSPSALRALLSALVPPVILIVAVLGSILMGIATATEAASVGAVGALLLGGKMRGGVTTFLVYAAGVSLFAILLLNHFYDFRIGAEGMNASGRRGLIFLVPLLLLTLAGMGASLWHLQKSGLLREVCKGTLEMTAMVFTILIGATIFSLVFRGLGGDSLVQEILTGLPGGTLGALIAVMAVIFVLGFFLDFVEISFVVVPIVAPVLLLMGINPVWLGVMIALNLQTSFLTPPFGFALFYLRGAAPKDITTGMIYKGVIPFVLIQLLALLLLALFPELATWLPSAIFGSNFKT